MHILAIDEAGKGCVIGPLVVCGVLISEEKVDELKKLGVKDSKLLTKEQRDIFFDKIEKLVVDYKIIKIPPSEIDDKTLNLNRLEAKKIVEIINSFEADVVVIDCPHPNTKTYENELTSSLEYNPKMVVEHKADLNHPEVAAASILAKVTRDNVIEKIKSKIGIDFGSGYPSDPKTKEFVDKYYDKYPEIFRKTWQTYKNVKKKKEQKKLGEF